MRRNNKKIMKIFKTKYFYSMVLILIKYSSPTSILQYTFVFIASFKAVLIKKLIIIPNKIL